MHIERTGTDNKDFKALVRSLDAYLAEMDGEEHAFYNALNKTTTLHNVVVLYHNGKALGCGALREFDAHTMEIKRMFTLPEARGKGIARSILSELEKIAAADGFKRCVLETGIKQAAAIALYKKCGYSIIANYGKYSNVANSVCFGKELL